MAVFPAQRLAAWHQIALADVGQSLLGQVVRDFGRDSGSPARLNFGDCFAYALAAERSEALLFKGTGFVHTDLAFALDDDGSNRGCVNKSAGRLCAELSGRRRTLIA